MTSKHQTSNTLEHIYRPLRYLRPHYSHDTTHTSHHLATLGLRRIYASPGSPSCLTLVGLQVASRATASCLSIRSESSFVLRMFTSLIDATDYFFFIRHRLLLYLFTLASTHCSHFYVVFWFVFTPRVNLDDISNWFISFPSIRLSENGNLSQSPRHLRKVGTFIARSNRSTYIADH